LLLSILLLPGSSSGQGQADSAFSVSFDNLYPVPSGCNAIDLDQEENIFLLDSRRHKVHKLFAATAYDSVLTIGGKGIGSEGFNTPVKIEAKNRQSVFVLDFNNRRLLTLNTNLKVVKEINFLELQERLLNSGENTTLFPISFAVGPSGELFILNQDNLKIYKLNVFGEPESSFGGLDYGEGSLADPVDLVLNEGNFMFVSDTTNQKISVFDLYGTYQYALFPEASFRWSGVKVAGQVLICYSSRRIFVKNLFTKQYSELDSPSEILDLSSVRGRLFVLTGNGVGRIFLTP